MKRITISYFFKKKHHFYACGQKIVCFLVYLPSGRWTDLPDRTLIHVYASSTSVGGSRIPDEPFPAGAPAVSTAPLSIPTISVSPAPWVAELVHADLPLEAVLVGAADLEAHALEALLPAGALRMRGALWHAVSLVAGGLGVGRGAAVLLGAGVGDAHAALLGGRNA